MPAVRVRPIRAATVRERTVSERIGDNRSLTVAAPISYPPAMTSALLWD